MESVLLITGSRYWKDTKPIVEALTKFRDEHKGEVTLIHGGCKGADTIAGAVAEQLGFTIEVYKADWKRYGRGAGPIRNKAMIDRLVAQRGLGKGVYVIGFRMGRKGGTQNCIDAAAKVGIGALTYDDFTYEEAHRSQS